MSDIKNTLEAMFRPEDVFELRILHKAEGERWTHSGFYTLAHSAELEQQALKFNKLGDQVYVTLNPINVDSNHVGIFHEKASKTTTDAMIAQRRWLPLDFDPVRPTGTSSTNEQVEDAVRTARSVKAFLADRGWPAPIEARSGNGVHLLYPINLPADDGGLCRSILNVLADKFSTETISLDRTLHNASRIIKLYGTISQKGDMRRKAVMTYAEDRLADVTVDLLHDIAPQVKEEVRLKPVKFKDFDLPAFLERADLQVQRTSMLADGRRRYILERCYFNPEHTGSEVAIFEGQDGKLGYKCFHNSCSEHDWTALREAVDGTPTERVLRMFDIPPAEEAESDLEILPKPSMANRTEQGNAERIVVLARGKLLYVKQTGKWLTFNESGWHEDQVEPMRLAVHSAKLLLQQMDSFNDPKEIVAVTQWYKQSLGAKALKNALDLAANMLSVDLTDFDTDKHLLGVQNGVINMREGTFRPYRVTDRILRQAAVSFDETAECPEWERVLYEIMQGDGELVDFFQRSFGYSLTGETSAQKLMFCYGFGANGKSTVMNVLREIAGQYAAVAQADVFASASSHGANASPELAALAGARVVIAQETEEDAQLKAALVKQLSGGDAITARHLYGAPFTFTPQFQVWMSGNHKPDIKTNDHGVWRRMTLIPFNRKFSKDEQDKSLDSTLRREYAGILNWIVKGAMRFYKSGVLGIPTSIESATDDYKSDMDHIGRFLEDCGSMDGEVKCVDAWSAFTAWAVKQGHIGLAKTSQHKFTLRMKERGFKHDKRRDAAYFLGLSVVNTSSFGV